MQIILLKDIKKLGNKNDIKNVADGYAMNFLIPQKLAIVASEDKIKQLQTEKESEEIKKNKEIKEIEEIINKISNKKIIIKKQASNKGKLFAAVSLDEILAAVKKDLGVSLEKKDIKLDKHIKEMGEHQVPLEIQGKTVVINLEVKK